MEALAAPRMNMFMPVRLSMLSSHSLVHPVALLADHRGVLVHLPVVAGWDEASALGATEKLVQVERTIREPVRDRRGFPAFPAFCRAATAGMTAGEITLVFGQFFGQID
jgi:hypothetical protein